MRLTRSPRGREPTAIIDSHATVGAEQTPTRTMATGVRWTAPTQVIIQLIQIVSLLVLTRLLTPAEFGLVALATVVTGFFERVLGDTGTTVAIIRLPALTQGLASSVLYWNLLIGAVTCAFFAVWGETIARWLGDAEAGNLLRMLGLLAVVNSLAHVPTALFRRRFQFQRIAIVNLTNTLVTAVASIALALAGAGPWSLVIGTITGSAVALALAWAISEWRPSWYFSRRDLRQISSFSTNLSVQNVFGYASFAGDRFIIGRFIGTTALGYYGLANRLMRYPVQTTAQTFREVVFPNLALLQDDHPRMTDTYRRSLNGIAFVIFPICCTIAAVAQPLIGVALSDEWRPVSSILGIIAITAGLQAVGSTTGSLYNARGRADLSLRWQVGSSLVLVACYSVGAQYGVVGVAWGFLIGTAALTPLSFAIPLHLIGARITFVLRGVVHAGLAAGAAAIAGHGVARLVDEAGGIELAQLVAGTCVSVGLYLLYALLARPGYFRDSKAVLRR
jgi:PST family polysaccharide transporter